MAFLPAFFSAFTKRSAITHSFGGMSSVRVWPVASVMSPGGHTRVVVSLKPASNTFRHFASNALSAFTPSLVREGPRVPRGHARDALVGDDEGVRLAPNWVQSELAASTSMYSKPAPDFCASSKNAGLVVKGTSTDDRVGSGRLERGHRRRCVALGARPRPGRRC